MAGFFAFFILFILGVVAFGIIAQWKIYTKAGQPGWACLIPIYGALVLLKIVGKPWWWIFLLWFPVFSIWTINMLSKSFGKDEGFTVGILLLGIVFLPILAFSDAKYLGPYGDPAAFQAAQQPHFDFDQSNAQPQL